MLESNVFARMGGGQLAETKMLPNLCLHVIKQKG